MNIMKKFYRMAVLLVSLFVVFGFMAPDLASAAVRLNKTSASVVKGETLQLKVKGTKKKAKWASSDESIATVSRKGRVKAKTNEGMVNITAEVNNRTYYCAVTVVDVTCEVKFGTVGGGDLITSNASSGAVLEIGLSNKVKKLSVDVCDSSGRVIKTYDLGSAKTKKCVWDLTDEDGNKVESGTYHYVIHASGCTFETEGIEVREESEFESGNGSVENPYEVADLEHLRKVSAYPNSCFVQTADIDANFEDFEPLFEEDIHMNGTYDGGNHTISNIIIDSRSASLFGTIGENGVVKNLNLDGCSFKAMISGGGITDGNDGTIENCAVRNTEVHVEQLMGGGICASNNGEIKDCIIQKIAVFSNVSAGGIVGYNEGTISNCRSLDSELTVDGHIGALPGRAGGIAGQNAERSKILNCEVTKNTIKATGTNYVHSKQSMRSGGVAGENYGTINGCRSADCSIEAGDSGGMGPSCTGGMAGWNKGIIGNGVVTNCRLFSFPHGNYKEGSGYSGGIAGYSSGTVSGSQVLTVSIDVKLQHNYQGERYLGGIIGYSAGNCIRNTYENQEGQYLPDIGGGN